MTAETTAALGVGGPVMVRRVLGTVLVVGLLIAVGSALLNLRDPASFRNRASLPSCGDVEQSRIGVVPRGAVRCLEGASRSGQGGELRVTFFTDEGDPIAVYYRALPSGGVEIFTDNTQDAFGTRGWFRQRCAEATGIPDPGLCVPVPV